MDSEIYETARNIMRQRRNSAEAEQARRTDLIRAEIPEIQRLNGLLFSTGGEMMRAIASGEDASEKIERIRLQNFEAQEKIKQLLVAHGYPADYLNAPYICKKCKDTGETDGRFCPCMITLRGRLMAEKFNRNTSLELSRFEDFNLKYYTGEELQTMRKILDFTRNYAENFTTGAKSLMMSGNTGLGKTHLSLAIAERVIRRGIGVIYDSTINILSKIEAEKYGFQHSTETLNAVLEADLLILDDLGTEQGTQFHNSTIFNIIDTRLHRRKSTIISTNLSLDDIAGRYGARTASRLSSTFTQLRFTGKDVRLQRRMEAIRRR